MIPLSQQDISLYLDIKDKSNGRRFCSITLERRRIHIIRKTERKQSERRSPANDNLISVRHKYVISEPLPYRPGW